MFRNSATRMKLQRILSIALAAILILLLPSCSKPAQEAEEPEEAAEVETEDISIYGDASLGIDANVGKELRDYRNILFAGIDNGHRADIQLILSINEATGESKMFTVTRDAYMQIAHGETVEIDDRELEFCKCNRAFEIGDKYDLMKELNRHLDLNIKEFIGVDWACAAKAVDLLGGVECEIESQSMLDAINGLISSFPDADADLIPGTGTQLLSGWQAVQYLRVRKYDGGNAFSRETHNRAFLSSVYSKVKNMSVEEIAEVYDEIADDLDTNMSRTTLTDTLATMSTSQIEDTGGWPYEYTTLWEPDEYFNYKVPQSLYSNVVELHANLFGQDNYLPSATVQELNDKITELEKNYLIEK